MQLLNASQLPVDTALSVLSLPADADPHTVDLTDLQRIDLHFARFTDGRAFSQAVMLRRRGYRGALRATGDVLIDQLLQMQRCGFSEAVLRPDQDLAHGERLLKGFAAFYQGDTLQPRPVFARPVVQNDPVPAPAALA